MTLGMGWTGSRVVTIARAMGVTMHAASSLLHRAVTMHAASSLLHRAERARRLSRAGLWRMGSGAGWTHRLLVDGSLFGGAPTCLTCSSPRASRTTGTASPYPCSWLCFPALIPVVLASVA